MGGHKVASNISTTGRRDHLDQSDLGGIMKYNKLCLCGGRTGTEPGIQSPRLGRGVVGGLRHARGGNGRERGTPVGSGGDFERLRHLGRGDGGDGCVAGDGAG